VKQEEEQKKRAEEQKRRQMLEDERRIVEARRMEEATNAARVERELAEKRQEYGKGEDWAARRLREEAREKQEREAREKKKRELLKSIDTKKRLNAREEWSTFDPNLARMKLEKKKKEAAAQRMSKIARKGGEPGGESGLFLPQKPKTGGEGIGGGPVESRHMGTDTSLQQKSAVSETGRRIDDDGSLWLKVAKRLPKRIGAGKKNNVVVLSGENSSDGKLAAELVVVITDAAGEKIGCRIEPRSHVFSPNERAKFYVSFDVPEKAAVGFMSLTASLEECAEYVDRRAKKSGKVVLRPKIVQMGEGKPDDGGGGMAAGRMPRRQKSKAQKPS